MKSPKLVALAALAILAIFAVAACGASSSSPTGASTTTSAGATTGAGATADADTTTAPSGGGTTTASAPAGGAVDMCALLSPADLKTATGSNYGAGDPSSPGYCTWTVGTGFNHVGQVAVSFVAKQLSDVKSGMPGGVDVTVSGHAGYWQPESGVQTIWVDLGGRVFALSLDPVGPDAQAIAQKLAEIAIGKI